MYRKQVEQINKDLQTTDKVIISIGCSFVQGQGAVNDELYTDYKWDYLELGKPLEISVSEQQRKDLLKQYPSLIKDPRDKLDFTFMEYDNAFVNVLCKKYFNGEYVPINLGIRGCGNRASIKELYFYPNIDWDRIKEIVVIYCPSGLERFDFANDNYSDHFQWKCMWPHFHNMEDTARRKLWEGYNKTLWSDKFEVMEQIGHVQELMSWCKQKSAKLIITPGFDRRYNRKHFAQALNLIVQRNGHGEFTGTTTSMLFPPKSTNLIDLFPWDKIFEPAGQPTFADLAIAAEGLDPEKEHFFNFLEKASPGGWITLCAHPSQRAHDLFAKKLHEYILSGAAT